VDVHVAQLPLQSASASAFAIAFLDDACQLIVIKPAFASRGPALPEQRCCEGDGRGKAGCNGQGQRCRQKFFRALHVQAPRPE